MEHSHQAIHLDNTWARRTPPTAQQEQGGHGGSALNPDNSAVYVTISNHRSEPDGLVAATTDIAAAVELYETIEGRENGDAATATVQCSRRQGRCP
jgi:copper(I)-binding protein